MRPDDSALLERVFARDQRAWRDLVRRHEPRLREAIGESVAEHDVDDVLGDFWLLLLEDDLRRLRNVGGDDLGQWLAMVAAQVAANHARRLARQPSMVSLDEVRDLAADESPYLTTEEAARYLKYGSASAIRSLVARGELAPTGAGPRGTLMFVTQELDRFVESRGRRRVLSVRHAAPGEKGVSDADHGRTDEVSGRAANQRQNLPGADQAARSTHGQTNGGGQAHQGQERQRRRSETRKTHGRETRAAFREESHSRFGLREIVDRVKGRDSRRRHV
jgi:DNA-directed RNA polymerase specialized sigma24 family protein